MKSFLLKFIICMLPCVLAGWITAVAVTRFIQGEPGGFKLGVDLVGGTILVYEIDLKKKVDADKSIDQGNLTNLLAESLKRRIDPNDLYNIVIRPAGGEGRVEIILPTGGIYRTKKAEEAWDALLTHIKNFYAIKEPLEVGRGKTEELADRIQVIRAQKKWEDVFRDDKAWQTLLKHTYDKTTGWPELDEKTIAPKLAKLPKQPVDKKSLFDPLIELLVVELREAGTSSISETNIKNWIKLAAWQEMLGGAMRKWTFLEAHKDDLMRIPPDNNEQLITFISAKGNVFGQAVLTSLEPALGTNILTSDKFEKREEIKKFVEDNYGPSLNDIRKTILEETEKTGRSRDLTVEEVQRIKDLVAKVGSLEFRMLANSTDEKPAIDAAAAFINDLANKSKLEEYQKDGLPPPGPRDPVTDTPRQFEVNLPRGNKSTLTYSWVELGPQERRSLNLDNAAELEVGRNGTWNEAKLKRGQATTLREPSGSDRKWLQGALFYSRECLNRNLPEEERRSKKVEYFVLARDPEIELATGKPSPKIDGSYLISAIAGTGQDLRPAVHFQFNSDGGKLFGNLTRKNVPSGTGAEESQIRRHLSIILDGLVMSAPTINSEITTHGQISGSFTQKEVDNLVNILRSGALPATLKPQPVSESTMGPTLGQDTIQAGVTAVGLAFMAVLAFMIVYYRFAGLVASIALLANLLLTVGFMVSVQATFTLPGLAGLVLMLGMAVDANVLIYERLREERERGASLALAIRNGYDRALPTIIDTHLSSIFTAIVLYIVGNDQLKGFGVSLTVGLIISLFTSLFMTRLMFDFWLKRNWLHKLSMLRLFARPDLDFMGIRNVMFAATLTLSILGIGLFIGRLPNDLNIDFVGGTAYGGKLNRAVEITELRDLVSTANQEKQLGTANAPKVQVTEDKDSSGTHFTLTYQNPDGTKESRSVFLVKAPDGNTPEQREKSLQVRAIHLPDYSVEQVFLSEELAKASSEESNKSPNFNIRTSEKEPELVQATLDRLLRDAKGTPLMKKVYMEIEKVANREKKLTYFTAEDKTKKDDASPSFVQSLFNRQMLRLIGVTDKADQPKVLPKNMPAYKIYGEGKSTPEGRYHIIRIMFDSAVPAEYEGVVKTALESTRNDFTNRPAPDRLEVFDSTLANETRFRAMWAILASWGAILLYLWFRFGNWTFGLAAVICLVHDLFFTLGVIASCHFVDGTFFGNILGLEDFKIDLPAVAALLTLVGYSVNDTIVVFDRIREVRGKNPDLSARMINDSINQTLSRTVLASLTTWLVVFVLYVWGGPGVHLFAFVMVVGVIVGTYSSIYIASPLLLMFGEGVHGDARAPSVARAPVTAVTGEALTFPR